MDTKISNYSPSIMASGHHPIISFRALSCLRPSGKETVRKCDDGGPFYHPKFNFSDFDEPASPRVGCMGQIKRDKVGYTGSKGPKFFKLKKIFSGKNLSRGISAKFDGDYGVISIVELDPPLPVPKRVIKECNAVSLWKRRCGQPLEGLQLHPQQQPQSQPQQQPQPQQQ
ncbi:uncharacterized protein LOC131244038 [Magnolia sinica]|uniref:uncharacterized protein LOC131244038 n=1 Tax=Magnolia sinica TaxID=86752 RepID=UPI00265820BC|nr:uncharacterized protein LOC131244038 [Magnolia sinica]